jgi:hypothetical protein
VSLIVETGAGSATSESYASVSDFDTRVANLGLTLPAAITTTAQKEQALRRATTFMLQAYRDRWQGYRQHLTQALDWPRYGVTVDGFYVPVDSVPSDVKNACVDLAFKATSDDLNADLTRGIVREKVGPIETEYDRNSPQSTRRPAIEMTLSPYLKGGSGMARLVRS